MWTSLQPFRFARSQRRQHARMIRAGILTDDEDRIGMIEVFERDRSLPDADRFAQRSAARLVTHVRAVRQIVGAKLSDEELIKKRGFVAGATGGVEDCLVRIVERIKFTGDQFERVVPARSAS